MFLINRDNNTIEKISKRSFGDLGFRERNHLQEWLSTNPEALGEPLLIIQKEFDGFSDTRERLDLLALDKQGNLVIIENKLDDSGRDVTWQVLKYASYCSSFTKSQIINVFQNYLTKLDSSISAEERLTEFFDNAEIEDISLNDGLSQRVMLIAANFRKEVTSTVLWLMNYKLRIQCFKVTPYSIGDQLLLNIEQIIPMKDAEEYTIKMAEKTQEDISTQEELKNRHVIRYEFWEKLLHELNQKSTLYQNISPTKYNWIGAGTGMRGVGLNFAISKNYGRCELYIDRGDQEENKLIFDQLFSEKEEIEKKFGGELTWERLNEKRASRIKYEDSSVNVFQKEDWGKMIIFMVDGMIRLENAFKDKIRILNRKVRT